MESPSNPILFGKTLEELKEMTTGKFLVELMALNGDSLTWPQMVSAWNATLFSGAENMVLTSLISVLSCRKGRKRQHIQEIGINANDNFRCS